MSLELCVLASGSGGNCSMLRTPTGVMLIDAGIGPRTAANRMNGTGVTLRDVAAICLTHLDSDHFNSTWVATIVNRGIQLFCHEDSVPELLRLVLREDVDRVFADKFRGQIRSFNGQQFDAPGEIKLSAISLAHDREGSHGFIIEGFGARLGYATDLGHVPPDLIERFCDLDLLAIESNYDPEMQLSSARPWFLKNRIMSGSGHLSNDQAMAAIGAILDRCERNAGRLPAHIVLLHRSRQCNCPKLVRKLFSHDARIGPRLVLAEQFHRTEWLRVQDRKPLIGEQLAMSWG